MSMIVPYDRRAALRYAHHWAFGRNPAFYDFEEIGGDCTNYASQCLYAGTGIMDFTPEVGWYYRNPDDRAAAWTGVEYFYRYLTRETETPGPFAIETGLDGLQPGDFIQFRMNRERFGHTPIVVQMGNPPTLYNTLIAAHSYDADYRALSTYFFQEIRFLHILGARKPEPGEGGEEGNT